MKENLAAFIRRLDQRFESGAAVLSPPYLYLDREAVSHVFQDLYGLETPPGRRASGTLDGGSTDGPAPIHLTLAAMEPALAEKAAEASTAESLSALVHNFARVRGRLGITRFPDGNLNLEIDVNGIRGLLFYEKRWFNSLVRPLLEDDRIFTLDHQVEALVFIHDRVRRTIFYHMTYGDNQEHDWLPLGPVFIKTIPGATDSPDAGD